MTLRDGLFSGLIITFSLLAVVFLVYVLIVPGAVTLYQQAWSTILSAILGFTGLVSVTYMGFREARKSREEQASWDRSEHVKELKENRQTELKRQQDEARFIATALISELTVIENDLKSFILLADSNAKRWEEFAAKSEKHASHFSDFTVSWKAVFRVYESNLQKLGYLPITLASNVVSIASSVYREDETENLYASLVGDRIRLNKERAEIELPKLSQTIAELFDFISSATEEPELLLVDDGVRV